MNKYFSSLRLKLFLAGRTLGYTYDYTERLYKIYLNHCKVIHFRDGYPIYSLSSPALFSKPSANLFARIIYRSIQNKNLPNMLSFAVDDRCNASCEHCSFYDSVFSRKKQVLSTGEAKKVIADAQELGVSVINFVGGEPLLRQDLNELIRSVDKDLSTTVLFTNGFLLKERAPEIKKAGLDSVYVSIDSADPQTHDRFRKVPGLFNKAIESICTAKTLGLSTGLSCTLTPDSFTRGEFDRLVELAKKIGVHEVLVFDAMPTGRYKSRKDLINNDWVEDLITASKKYNDDPSYPGVLVWAYSTSHRSVGCACGTSSFYVSPYGDVSSCDFNHTVFGNVRKTPLFQIWDYLSSLPDFKQAKWGGCKIKDQNLRDGGVAKP